MLVKSLSLGAIALLGAAFTFAGFSNSASANLGCACGACEAACGCCEGDSCSCKSCDCDSCDACTSDTTSAASVSKSVSEAGATRECCSASTVCN